MRGGCRKRASALVRPVDENDENAPSAPIVHPDSEPTCDGPLWRPSRCTSASTTAATTPSTPNKKPEIELKVLADFRL